MCGFAGIVKKNQGLRYNHSVKPMVNLIKHRGPDNTGLWENEDVSLGHVRLSIIDLSSAANQPFCSPCGRYILVYNGEVYNFPSLKKTLAQQGYCFNSQSDTEVVLAALIEWGANAVTKFNGMFSFAFYDVVKSVVLLGRDRYGIKPLYYVKNNNKLIFASEQKALNACPEHQKEINEEAVLEYFAFQNIYTDENLSKNVKTLMPGNVLHFDISSGRIRTERYWDFNFEEPTVHRPNKYLIEEFQYLFERAISQQLTSDVEVGSYLSGGIDTGTIVAHAAKYLPKMKTFTCGFDMDLVEGLEINFDERPQAKFIADYFDLDFFDTVLGPGDMEQCHESLIWHIDEPRIGQSYPNYYAAKLASQHVKVVLSGTGGDEIFAGYPWRYDWIKNGSDPFDESSGYFIFWRRLIGNEDFKTLMQPLYSKNPQFNPKEVFSNVFGSDHLKSKRREDLLNQTLRFEAKTFLHSLLLLEDKISMAHSLESRVPFLDNDLVDFAMKCPASIKLAANFKPLNFDENKATRINNKKHLKTKAGKLIIREALRGSAPEVFRNATKQGFSGPDSTWYRGKSISFVEHFLSKKEAILYNFLDRATVRKYFDEHISGVKNHRLLIWSLISFEQFLQNFYSSET